VVKRSATNIVQKRQDFAKKISKVKAA